jgi:hypothetical protein
MMPMTQLRTCQGSLSGPDAAGCLTAGGGPVALGFALYLAGVAAALLAWLLGLIKTASIGRWGWFLLVLLLSPLGSLLYGLAGPAHRASARCAGVRVDGRRRRGRACT